MNYINSFRTTERAAYFNLNGITADYFGDSIVNFRSPFTAIKNATGISNIYNFGFNGRRLCCYGGFSTDVRMASSGVYQALSSSGVDLVIVSGGVNDSSFAGSETDMSTIIGDISDTTFLTYYGALKVMNNGLRAMFPNKHIVYLSPAYAIQTSSQIFPGNVGQLSAATVNFCSVNNIPCFDQYNNGGINAGNVGTYTSDGLHPNASGYSLLESKIIPFLQTLT